MDGEGHRRGRRSSSRSPSLTRRPSLKEKSGGIRKASKKASGGKKERWLLTRKTWRYMTDAVGTLLPEHHRASPGSSTSAPSTPAGPSSRRTSSALGSPEHPTLEGSTGGVSVSSVPAVVPASHGSGMILAGAGAAYEQRQQPRQSVARASICSGTGTGYAATTNDIPGLEAHFATVCTKERKFLLWTRTRAKGLSGPALRELKQEKGGRVESPEDRLMDDDYDEYEDEIPVREGRRKSSIISMVSGGLSFFRPQSSQSTAASASHTQDCFYVVTVAGVTKYFRSTGIQTEPFPEEILIRLRLQSAEEKRIQAEKAAQSATESVVLIPIDKSEVPKGSESGPSSPPVQAADTEPSETSNPVPSEGSGGPEPDKKSEESGYSSSISDTVMRYLRMARKNSKADTKEAIDKFKTVNYDRTLRYIKSKNVTVEEALEHEKNKALQAQAKLQTSEPGPLSPPSPEPGRSQASSPTPTAVPTAHSSTEAPISPPQTPTVAAPKATKSKKSPGLKLKTSGSKAKVTAASTPIPVPGTAEISVEQQSVLHPPDPSKCQGTSTEGFQVEASLQSSSITPSASPPPGQIAVSPAGEEYPVKQAEPEKRPNPPASIGVQAGESLIRFLRYFNPMRKFSDFSSASCGSSESPADVTSPRYSIATGSDTSDLYGASHEMGGGPNAGVRLRNVGRSTGGDYSGAESGEYEDMFQCEGVSTKRDSSTSFASGVEAGVGLSKSASAQHIRTCGSSTSVSGSSTYSFSTAQGPGPRLSHHHSYMGGSTPTTPTSSPAHMTKSHSASGIRGSGSFSRPQPSAQRPSLSLASSASQFLSHLRPGGRGVSGSYPSGGGGGFAESISSFMSKHSGSRGSGKGTGVSFKGSSPEQKGGLSLPLTAESDPNPASSSLVMQKSKSSSSVLHQQHGWEKRGSTSSTGQAAGGSSGGAAGRLMSKTRIFKSRSKSQTRIGGNTCTWTPQGKCKWTSVTGRQVTLEVTSVLALSDVERMTLQKVALAKLQALNLGVEVKIPREKPTSTQKPKRRPYLLKKKALSTGFFDSGSKREDGKESGGSSGLVFGIPLSQCVTNDRQKRGLAPNYVALADWEHASMVVGYRASQNGSRNSVSSVYEGGREDKSGSSESLFWQKRGSNAALDNISCSSADLLAQENIPAEPSQASHSVPTIVTACIRHLEAFGLHTTGIFRVSTSLKRIRQLREDIDAGKEVEFGAEHSPHDIAALLKEFLRDLPEPLLCRDLYQAFLLTQKIRNRRLQLEAVQHLIQLLPVPNRDTLAILLQFFAKVVENASDTRSKTGELLAGNKMEGYSLATLIAPNILPCMPTEGSVPTMDQNVTLTKERRESIDVVNYMISSYKELFDVTPELLDEVYIHMMDTHPDIVEAILKYRAKQQSDDPSAFDELETTSSVFEGGSESGEMGEAEDGGLRKFQRREDILHRDGGKGGQPETRGRGKRDGSKERGASDAEKQQSGGESDSSSTSVTKSTSRWFRRGRADTKARTTSDSGSEKTKAQKRDSCLLEAKRASSLDSVSLKEAGLPTVVQVTEQVVDRQRSCSDQSLKVPESLSRRQSSPVLEGSGVITASLKIPVPLNIDDTDIPYIEEEGGAEPLHAHHLISHLTAQQQAELQGAASRSRGRSASTDSSAPVRNTPSASSSHTTTPLSSPHRQTSSEVSSPMTFSPPSSPPYDPATFPYEEMTARFCLGASPLPAHSTTRSVATKPERSTSTLAANPTPAPYVPAPVDLTRVGKETKGASIAGLIKSKTADFEKFAQDQQQASSIAPNMRLRSQGNIALKQQFLLRQQSKPDPPQTRGEGESVTGPGSRSLTRKKPLAASSAAILGKAEPTQKLSTSATTASGSSKATSSTTAASSSAGTGSVAGSRWKRSEIIASRHPGPSSGDPETFV